METLIVIALLIMITINLLFAVFVIIPMGIDSWSKHLPKIMEKLRRKEVVG